ncbi:MAG: carbon-nitrogen hydrolase [Bacteroidetes Order II. Incertae sedis bacterium]|nr:carbon-nitrogen hydrolase [Bacteroidetes Order II. bacterium]
MNDLSSVKIALLQLSCGPDVTANEAKTIEKIQEAATHGAQIICLQELYNAVYFPQRVEVSGYRYAQPLPNPTTQSLSALAAELGVVIIVPIYEEALPGVYFNTVVVFDADGRDLGKYRKTHIPDGPQYLEKYYFTPGNLGYPVFQTMFGCIAVGICWDEWFPEVARIFALQGAGIIFYPSAIGSEPDRPDYSSDAAWQTVIRSHGITNGVFIAAVNRVGTEDEMTFYGKSFVSDPFGDLLAQAGSDETILYADCALQKIREARELLHFLRDRRVDTYQPLLNKLMI